MRAVKLLILMLMLFSVSGCVFPSMYNKALLDPKGNVVNDLAINAARQSKNVNEFIRNVYSPESVEINERFYRDLYSDKNLLKSEHATLYTEYCTSNKGEVYHWKRSIDKWLDNVVYVKYADFITCEMDKKVESSLSFHEISKQDIGSKKRHRERFGYFYNSEKFNEYKDDLYIDNTESLTLIYYPNHSIFVIDANIKNTSKKPMTIDFENLIISNNGTEYATRIDYISTAKVVNLNPGQGLNTKIKIAVPGLSHIDYANLSLNTQSRQTFKGFSYIDSYNAKKSKT